MEADRNMSERLQYTSEEIAVIDGVMGSLYPLMRDETLKDAYWAVHEHLQSGAISGVDLSRIESALELADPCQCVSCNKESYRGMTTLLIKTKAMLRQTQ